MTDSRQLLAEYVSTGSEAAFRELVARYLSLVYSSAVRLVDGDKHLAEDVAQTVFADLARQARTLPAEVMLGGWLHRHTCFVAAKTMRGERRRQSRERQVAEMNALQDHSEANLAQLAPVLDEAINQLDAVDRTAILARYFEQQNLRSVGEALGTTEEAARKRVDRALEKLHSLLGRRGVAFSAGGLGTMLAAGAVSAAPAGLATTVSAGALASAALVASGTTVTFFKLTTMTQLKIAVFSAVAGAAALATPIIIHNQSQSKREQESLRRQTDEVTALTADNTRLSNELAQAKNGPALSPEQLNDLMRLRGEVAALRQQAADAAKLRSENQQLRSQPSTFRLQINPPQAASAAEAQNQCINNLRLIDGATQQFALENNLTATNIVTAENIQPYMGKFPGIEFPHCPSGGIYTFGRVDGRPTCSVPGHSLQ